MTDPPAHRPTYTIRLRPTPGCVDPIKSLRRLLKIALRTCRLRCVSITEEPK